MFQIAATVIGGLFTLLKGSSKSIAESSGVDETVVGKVLAAVESYTSKDERMQNFLAEELDKARRHDIATQVKGYAFIDVMRGGVRPIITYLAMGWYVYARVNGLELLSEDYAIIGGILTFWFGMRPFEKKIGLR